MLINPILDRIDFISLEQVPTIFAELDAKLAIFHTSSTLGLDPKNKIYLLSIIKELLDPENMYAANDDLPDLHIVILK